MKKMKFEGRGCVGDVTEVRGTSMSLNGQRGSGAQKPAFSGSESPGGTKPKMAPEAPVPMPR